MAILDLHSQCVTSLAARNRMMRDLAVQALNLVIALRRPPKEASIIRIAATNIVHMNIRSFRSSLGSKCPLS